MLHLITLQQKTEVNHPLITKIYLLKFIIEILKHVKLMYRLCKRKYL